MSHFDHEKLDVYRSSIEFVALAHQIVRELPRGNASPADQLSRAASSISLNIVEGAGEFSSRDKARFYRMARRSATECASILDVFRCRNLGDADKAAQGKALLLRIVSMLVKLSKRAGGVASEESQT